MIEDDPEPESPEAKSIDYFFEAIMDGKGHRLRAPFVHSKALADSHLSYWLTF
jgi:hypothetical protein